MSSLITFGLATDTIDDVIDADGVRNVVDEVNQPADANRREVIAPTTVTTGAKGVGSERAAGSAAMQ
jgi:hypothetical protein